jgi:chromosome segregation ATPase
MAKKMTTRAGRKRSPGAKVAKVAKVAAKELNQLKATVKGLKNRLLQEVRRRQMDAKLMAAARKTRQAVNQQVTKFRAEGRKLAGELKATLERVKRHESASRDAQAQVRTLTAQLRRKDQELSRKDAEIERLTKAMEARPAQAPSSGASAAPAADESARQNPLFPSEPSGWNPPSGESSD